MRDRLSLGDMTGKKKSRVMAARAQRSKYRVVVAENNVESRTDVCRVVEQLNCVAVPAVSVSEVLKVMRNRRVDLVLLDLDLVRSEDLDVVDKIKQLVPLVPVVMMSHVMTPHLARRLCDRGAQSFLVKPVRRDQLALALFRYLL